MQKKDIKTGMLYGVMIYKMTDSYDDAAIILADSGMLQSTAEKKHLVLTLHSGEWFENMKSQEFSAGVSVPYRRETFVKKRIVLDFDADFNVADASALSNNARGKSIGQINRDVDSLNHVYDSVGRVFYKDAKMSYYSPVDVSKKRLSESRQDGRDKDLQFRLCLFETSADRSLRLLMRPSARCNAK